MLLFSKDMHNVASDEAQLFTRMTSFYHSYTETSTEE